MRNDLQPFWFVWCPNGGAPTFKHPSFESAQAEAKRLARIHRDSTFIVLQSVFAAFVCDVQIVDMTPEGYEEIPF